MLFNHDTDVGMQAAVALANSALDPDTLETLGELDAFYHRFHYTGRHDGDAAELAAMRGIRGRLYELLTAPRDDAAVMVNDWLAESSALPQLIRHGGGDWHIHAIDLAAPLATRIIVETCMAMVDMIRLDETSRLSVCAVDDCLGIVLDLSRNRSRRYCSTSCGNREAVAAYRARRAVI